MKVLVACEYSGTVRDAFRRMGHDAWSCDILPCDADPTFHYQKGIYQLLHGCERNEWDLIIAHPPCTYLAVSGNRWYSGSVERDVSIAWTIGLAELMTEKAGRWAIENPVGVLSSEWRKPDQYVQPWQFGHGETEKTGLWLHNLPKLTPSNIVEGRESRIHKMPPSADRGKLRSLTYKGIAEAMAFQWGIDR